MLKKPYVTLFAVACYLCSYAVAKDTKPYLRPVIYNQESGLSGNFIRGLLQDFRGYIWIATSSGLNKFDGYTFHQYFSDFEDSSTISDDNAWVLYEDRQQRLWAGTSKGLDLYDRQKDVFHSFYPVDEEGKSRELYVSAIFEDSRNRFYIGTSNGLYLFDRSNLLYEKVPDAIAGPVQIGSWVQSIYEDHRGWIWVGTKTEGIYAITADGILQYKHQYHQPSTGSDWIVDIFQDQHQRIWVRTRNSFDLLDRESGKFRRHRILPMKDFSSDHREVVNIYNVNADRFRVVTVTSSNKADSDTFTVQKYLPHAFKRFARTLIDREGGLWTGSANNGVYYVNPIQFKTNYFSLKHQGRTVGANCFFERKDGLIWVGSGAGLYLYDRSDHLAHFILPGAIQDVFEDQNNTVWVALMDECLIKFNAEEYYQPQVKRYHPNPANSGALYSNHFTKIIEDCKGNLWVGLYDALCRYEPKQDVFTCYFYDPTDSMSLSSSWVWSLHEEACEQLWIATNDGLNRYDYLHDHFIRFLTGDPSYGPYEDFIWSITGDGFGDLWLATKNGLQLFSPEGGVIKSWQSHAGLPGRTVSEVIEDVKGRLWLMINQGLSCLDPVSGKIQNYGPREGLINNFTYNGSLSAADGTLFFNAPGGFIYFNPDSIFQVGEVVPPMVFTDFRVKNHKIAIRPDRKPLEGNSPYLERSLEELEQVLLPAAEKDFSITFSALSYLSPKQNEYQYRLLGYQNDWNNTTAENRTISYTNLSPGNFTFQARGRNSGGNWSEPIEMSITILPPWSQTWWAYCLYGLVCLTIGYLIYRQLKNQWLLETQMQIEHVKAERLQALQDFQKHFFTNITHEFRTPLTIILGMVEQIEKAPRKWLDRGLRLIQRSGKDLLQLVNQMLDLSKLEAGQMTTHYEHGDIVPFLGYLVQAFESNAQIKNIGIETDFSSEIMMDFDSEKIKKIVFNLMSNAVKYTNEGGSIFVGGKEITFENQPYLRLLFTDTGVGIVEAELPYIFDRFHRGTRATDEFHQVEINSHHSTGIGLAVTRELVHLLGGDIQVASQEGVGTTFTVLLPIHYSTSKQVKHHFQKDRLKILREKSSEIVKVDEVGKPLVLIVEDNRDVVQYLYSCLESDFRTIVEMDGISGMKKARELIPDIVVSDVMMPGQSGYQLCRVLKKDPVTSHIPIILLTARADVESRIVGLEHGADAYLSKPFDPSELEIRVKKLIDLRQRLREKYAKVDMFKPTVQRGRLGMEDKFLYSVQRHIERNMENSDFGMNELCKLLALSRTQLYRKLQAITGMSASQYLRSYRLWKARKLLRESEFSITEIAFQVGFKDLAHFSKSFKSEFDVNPSEIRNSNTKELFGEVERRDGASDRKD